jgi:hypothetical protein
MRRLRPVHQGVFWFREYAGGCERNPKGKMA